MQRAGLTVALLSIFLLMTTSGASAHHGRLDKNCGHNNKKTGIYHYHYERCGSNRSPRKIITGTVTKVKDGDTVVISPSVVGGKKVTCRLYGIDAPETPKRGKRGQAYGREADRELKNLVLGSRVDVLLTGDKTYGREVCIIKKGDVDINREMVKRGYAWAYREYLKGPYASEYISAETEARESKRGLWVQMNPKPPWEFRRK